MAGRSKITYTVASHFSNAFFQLLYFSAQATCTLVNLLVTITHMDLKEVKVITGFSVIILQLQTSQNYIKKTSQNYRKTVLNF